MLPGTITETTTDFNIPCHCLNCRELLLRQSSRGHIVDCHPLSFEGFINIRTRRGRASSTPKELHPRRRRRGPEGACFRVPAPPGTRRRESDRREITRRRKDGIAAEGSNRAQLRFPRNVQACCYESNRPDSSRFMVMRSRRATGVYCAQIPWRSTRTVYVEDRRYSVERSDRPTKTCPHSTKQPPRRGCRQAQVF